MDVFIARSVFANRGDFASQVGLIDGLKDIDEVNNILVSSYYPNHYVNENVTVVKPSAMRGYLLTKEEISILKKSGCILWGGGVDIQDSGSFLKLLFLAIRFKLLTMFGGRIFVSNQGAGPLKTTTGIFLAKQVLKSVSNISLREPTGYQTVKDLDVLNTLAYQQTVDGALLIKPRASNFGKDYLVSKEVDVTKPIIGLNIRRWFHQKGGLVPTALYRKSKSSELEGDMKEMVKSCALSLDYLIDSGMEQLILIPMYRAEPEPWEDDIFLLQATINMMRNKAKVVIVDEDVNVHELVSILSNCTFTIGGRLHSTILSHVAGVPAIHIHYEHKGVEHYGNIGQSDMLVDINDLKQSGGHELLIEKINSIQIGIEERKAEIIRKVSDMRINALNILKDTLISQ